MPVNQTPYWAAVLAFEAKLPIEENTFFITSLSTMQNEQQGIKAGVTKECPRRLAAERCVENSFRMATLEEIQNYQEQGRRNMEALAIMEAKRKPASAILKVDAQELRRLGELQK